MQQTIFWRHYRVRREQWASLYESASLRLAPSFKMFNLLVGDAISDCIAFTGLYEFKLSRHVCRLARRGGTMIDVGANMGYYTLLWAAGNSANRVLAIEASPQNICRLSNNLLLNQLGPRVTVIGKAAGKESGELPFDPGPEGQTGWGGLVASSSSTQSPMVEVFRIDELVQDEGEITLLKVDLEGADTWALLGCERLFEERLIREVWFEQHKPRMRSLGIRQNDAVEFLHSFGYRVTPRSNPDLATVEWSATRR